MVYYCLWILLLRFYLQLCYFKTDQIQETMAWVREDDRTWIQKLCMNVLKQGPIPKHIGFIMDGNRRYAQKSAVANIQGHVKGFEKLTETLRWCWDFGVTELTVYVFSIENFKRPKEEVDGLMKLAKEKFEKLLEENERLQEQGVCVQIIGDWSLVPPGLRPLMAKVMILTRHNSKAKLNVAFAYTSRNEITRGIRSIEKGLFDGDISLEDVSEDLLEGSFRILPSQPLDLLVRTSGETRLSDFLLWQSSETVLCFTKVLWPEFTIWHLMAAMFNYQVNYMSIKQLKLVSSLSDIDSKEDVRKNSFIADHADKIWLQLEKEAAVLS
ncbi:unnamed protein product [Allacma fusca]|uniref:Alkyl transferase n=1 Tax=Allacma fusca TaxID=39272 RepID=A0A8J2NWY9_9HEXA|nr:unnamed protein product [Allacma fusca]